MNANIYIHRKADYTLYEADLAKASDEHLNEISNELALGLSLDEMKNIQTYFKKEGRNPTDLELQTISQTWSEHCYHKTFKGKIQIGGKEIDILVETPGGLAEVAEDIVRTIRSKYDRVGMIVPGWAKSAGTIGLDYTANNQDITPAGNRIPNAAPHGIYRCKGEDRWCAIAVFSDQEWSTFCKVIDNPSLSKGDSKLSWDLTDNSGSKVSNGNYTFNVVAADANGQNITTSQFKYGTIDGVKFNSSGTVLLVDGAEYDISEITEITNSGNNGSGQ